MKQIKKQKLITKRINSNLKYYKGYFRKKVKNIVIIIFILFLIINVLSIFSLNMDDSSYLLSNPQINVNNLLGLMGANYSGFLYQYFGQTIYLLPVLIMMFYPIFFFKEKFIWLRKFFGLILVVITVGYMLAIFYPFSSMIYGGVIGEFSSCYIKKYFGIIGQLIFLLFLLFSIISFLIYRNIKSTISATKKINIKYFSGFTNAIQSFFNSIVRVFKLHNNMLFKKKQFKQIEQIEHKPVLQLENEISSVEVPNETEEHKLTQDNTSDDNNVTNIKDVSPVVDKAPTQIVMTDALSNNELHTSVQKDKPVETHVNNITMADLVSERVKGDNNTHIKVSKSNENYQSPIQGFALPNSKNDDIVMDKTFESTSRKLEDTLNEFNIETKVVSISRGPVVTRYELQPAPGIKLSRIVNLQDNIALSLAKPRIRIVAPIPGKSAVGIEIPNEHRQTVTLGDLLNSFEYKESNFNLPMGLGKDVSGKVVIGDLSTMPHLLIAGSTGSGKSVCINALICSILYSKPPQDVKFIMIDPKIVELKVYNDIPHLFIPVINESKDAIKALVWLTNEMEKRYTLLDQLDAKNIKGYNRKVMQNNQSDDMVKLEILNHIVLIVDEYADLMLSTGKEIETLLSRLAAKARAAGIHLIIATQRPSVDVITGIIKANFPARIAFQVTSKIESRIILDTNGAEQLIGKGDLLFNAPGLPSPVRIQGAYLSEEEVEELCTYLRSQGAPEYLDEILHEENSKYQGASDEDPLFEEAVETVLRDKKTSISYLQRKLKIGYNRSARLIELMEDKGIIGQSINGKAREILIDA